MKKIDDVVVLTSKIEPLGFTSENVTNNGTYLFILFQSDFLFSYDGIKYFDVPENTAILYEPSSMLTYKASTTKLINSFMYFTLDPTILRDFSFPLNTLIYVDKNYAEEIVFEMDRLSYIVNTPYAESIKDKIPDYVLRVLKLLNRASFDLKSKINTNSLKTTFSNIRNLMYAKPNDFTVKKMAKTAGFSETYFGIKYKEFFGVLPSEDRKIRIVEIIKYYLQKTDYSLSHLCDIFEIKSVAHLINIFKSIEGTTPNRYRASIRKASKSGIL